MKRGLKLIQNERCPIQSEGIVVERCDGGFGVETHDYGMIFARRAASCLIEPDIGDRVLAAGDLNEDLFIIAVLEREKIESTLITVEGDLQIGAPNGRVSIASAKGVEIVTTGEAAITSPEISIHSQKASLFFDHLSYIGRKVIAHTGAVRFIGEAFDTVAERISQKVKRSYKTVEEIDQVRSNQIDYRAEKNMSLKGRNMLVTADELVKLEGDQIHLG